MPIMFSRWVSVSAILGLLLSFTTLATALASPSDDAVRESERLQREQQIRQNNDTENATRSAHPSNNIEMPAPKLPKGSGTGCRNIKEIELRNANLIDAETQTDLTTPYSGKCLGVDQVEALLSDITRYYIDHGYATTRAYIPEQDMSTGKLIVLIVEGKVQQLKLEDGDKHSLNLDGAFPFTEGDTFNLRVFEQGLDQVNRLASNHATLDIQPGDNAGQSVVVIKNEAAAPWHAVLSEDNYGQRSTGRWQAAATGGYDNLLGINDYFSYTHRQSTPLNEHNQNSVSNNFLYSIPVGRVTLSAGYSNSAYKSQLLTPGNAVLELAGDSHNTFFKGDVMAWRDQDTKLSFSTTLTQKVSNSFADSQKLDVSSRTLTVLDLGFDLTTSVGKGQLDLNGGVSKGLPFWSALTDDIDLPTYAPRAQFTKLVAGANYNQPFTVDDEAMSFSSQVSAQYAFNVLYGSEQMSIGGPYSVRGFYITSVANDNGVYTQNNLSLSKPLGDYLGSTLTMKPYIGIDAGYVAGRADDTTSGTMVGAALGSSFNLGVMNVDIFTAHALHHPGTEDEGLTTYAKFSLSL